MLYTFLAISVLSLGLNIYQFILNRRKDADNRIDKLTNADLEEQIKKQNNISDELMLEKCELVDNNVSLLAEIDILNGKLITQQKIKTIITQEQDVDSEDTHYTNIDIFTKILGNMYEAIDNRLSELAKQTTVTEEDYKEIKLLANDRQAINITMEHIATVQYHGINDKFVL